MSLVMSDRPSVCQSIFPFALPSVSPSLFRPSVCQSISLSPFCLSVHLSFRSSAYFPTCQFVPCCMEYLSAYERIFLKFKLGFDWNLSGELNFGWNRKRVTSNFCEHLHSSMTSSVTTFTLLILDSKSSNSRTDRHLSALMLLEPYKLHN